MVVLQLMRCPCHAPVKPNDSLSGQAYRKLTRLRSNLQNEKPCGPLAVGSNIDVYASANSHSARLRSAAAAPGLRAGLTLSQSTARLRLIVAMTSRPRLVRLFDRGRIGHSDRASVAFEPEYVAPLTRSLVSRVEDDWVPICQNALLSSIAAISR
ncbi:hypothetical protein QA649_37015 [Bradyrhizobium sp. CB1717]|uniref:hypothetical protein n=1 Tax=Bradyrhizobium sp. CB1717 TaxID=3039154 RepID=UPI0024B2046A|nr:hypothetical protein [Bradyrhizobium sp. CB1717]WFU23563.1 hypothetical protein QA649_37015 [Bradyrhizobium sp. CB1717]